MQVAFDAPPVDVMTIVQREQYLGEMRLVRELGTFFEMLEARLEENRVRFEDNNT